MPTIAFFCSLLLATSTAVFAQAPGNLSGTVTADGLLMPGVRVTATNSQGTSQSTLSELGGDYVLRGLAPGTYTVTFSRSGYKSQTSQVQITSGQTSRQHVDLYRDTERETIIVTTDIEIIDVNNVDVVSDTATRVDSLPGAQGPPIFLDNTANLAANSLISERASTALIGIDVGVGSWSSDRVKLRVGAGLGYGNQDVTFIRNTGETIGYSGRTYTKLLNSYLTYGVGRHDVKAGVQYSGGGGDVTRDPTTSATGVVTEDHDFHVTRYEFESSFHYNAGRTTYFAGVEYYNYSYSLEHDINISYATPPGAATDIDGETKLKKSGGRAIGGITFTFSDKHKFTASVSKGSDAWSASGSYHLGIK